MTMAMGAAPPCVGARPVAGGHFGAGTRPVGSAHQQATLAAAQARSAAALRGPWAAARAADRGTAQLTWAGA